jgi:hypothetical protein
VCNELVAKLKPPNAVATRTDAAKALQDFLAFASKQALLTAKEAAREAGAIPPLILAASAVQHASDENQVDLGESALCALATVARDENGKNRLAIREAGGVALALKVVEGALARGAASIDTAEEALLQWTNVHAADLDNPTFEMITTVLSSAGLHFAGAAPSRSTPTGRKARTHKARPLHPSPIPPPPPKLATD